MNAIKRTNLNTGRVAFAKLKFSISSPRMKHFASEVITTLLVIVREKCLDFAQADLINRVLITRVGKALIASS